MEFVNRGNPVKIRIGKSSDCYWATIRKGETVELSAEMGLYYGFSVKTTKGQIGKEVVETKQIESVDFFKELCSINGIGRKTAKDITRIYPEREELIKTIRLNANTNALPFRDDIEKKLRSKYG